MHLIRSSILLVSLSVLSLVSLPKAATAAPMPACSTLGPFPINRITPSSFPASGSTGARNATGNPLACIATNNVQTPGHMLTYTVKDGPVVKLIIPI
jgi:hypothetical protein